MENKRYSYAIDETENGLKIVFSGRMETDFINEEMEKILAKIRECKNDVTIDMGGVDYISSSFLRLCVGAAKGENTGKRKVSVVRVNPSIKKVFKIGNLSKNKGFI